MGNAGWGYTSILILERAVVYQEPDLSLKGAWALSEGSGIVTVEEAMGLEGRHHSGGGGSPSLVAGWVRKGRWSLA